MDETKGGRLKVATVQPFSFRSRVTGGDITVPTDFVTDFASIPRPLWPLFPPMGKYAKAAVIHDYLYATQHFSRQTADDVFSEAMASLGVGTTTRRVIWGSVRAIGWRTWGRVAKTLASD